MNDEVPPPPPMTDFGEPKAIIEKRGKRYYVEVVHDIGYQPIAGSTRTLEQAKRKAAQALAQYRETYMRKPETWEVT